MHNRFAKVFSFAEANELVPQVAGLTEDVIRELDSIRCRCPSEGESSGSGISDESLKEVAELLRRWSERVLELGGRPKGYFTVDFQSIDPELLYCWNYGEDKICFTHKVWENFSHRRPLTHSIDAPGKRLGWVN